VAGSEAQADLAARTRENLSGYPNVTVHTGDGAQFDPMACDAMLINAGVTHPHPFWLGRMREGGRLVLRAALGGTHGTSGPTLTGPEGAELAVNPFGVVVILIPAPSAG